MKLVEHTPHRNSTSFLHIMSKTPGAKKNQQHFTSVVRAAFMEILQTGTEQEHQQMNGVHLNLFDITEK